MAQRLKCLPAMQETWVRSLGQEDPRKWQPTPVFLPGESHGWRSLVGYSPRDCKELDKTERLHSLTQGGHNFPSKEEASFNFMAAITIGSDFGGPPKESQSLFPLFPQLFAMK